MSSSIPNSGTFPVMRLEAAQLVSYIASSHKHEQRPTARKKRILHVALGTSVGGMEKLLVDFATFCDRQRFELSFVSLERRGRFAQDIEDLRWPVVDFDKKPGLRPGLVFRLARHMRKLDPDVVHTHNTAALAYGVSAAKFAGVKRVIHTRHGQRFGATFGDQFLFRALSYFVDQIVSVSEDGRRLTIDEGISIDRACTIANGVDLERFAYSGPKARGPAVLVARLSSEKDIPTLIHAVKQVIQELGSEGDCFTLQIVGDGALRDELESLTRSLTLQDRVHFLGERCDVPAILVEASMFVLPSLTEGISLTLLEAMARGLPVVATRVGGTPEVVVDGETGLLVSTGDSAELAQAIRRLYLNPQLGQQMGHCGRRRVEQEFPVQRMVQAYERLYEAPQLRGRRQDGRPSTLEE